RLLVIVLSAIPAVTAIGFMKLGAMGTVQQSAPFGWDIVEQMAMFAVHTYAHNPIAKWFETGVLAPWHLVGFLMLKTVVVALGLAFASKRLRPILIVLILFEPANDIALGA